MKSTLALLVLGFALAATLGVTAAAQAPASSPSPGLRALADKRNLLFGTAVTPGNVLGADTAMVDNAVTRNFNMIEPGNELKPFVVWKSKDHLDFTVPDQLVGAPGQTGWVQRNKMTLRGHVLVYDSQGYATPGWLRALDTPATQPSRTEAMALLRDYIHAVVGRYKGKIRLWDVVNEAVESGKSDDPIANPYHLRKDLWYRWIGPDYIDLAFQYAHEADPAAQLYYNDYNDEYENAPDRYDKFDNILSLVQHLRHDKRIPVNIGMQWHVDVNTAVTPGDGHYRAAQILRDNGIGFMITELDVRMPVNRYERGDPRFGVEPADPTDLQKQAAVYGSVLRLALNFPNCTGFQVWGFTDKDSWIPGTFAGFGAANILDANLAPKPAYFALADALKK